MQPTLDSKFLFPAVLILSREEKLYCNRFVRLLPVENPQTVLDQLKARIITTTLSAFQAIQGGSNLKDFCANFEKLSGENLV